MPEVQGLITVNIWQIVISLCNLLILFLILKKFLFKPVQAMFARRKEELDTLYRDAEDAKTEAARSRMLYEDKLAAADEEARGIVRRAMTQAGEVSDEILADTGRKVEQMKIKARRDLEQERKQMINSVKDEVAEMSVDIAEKVVGREIGEEDHRAMIDRCIAQIGQTDRRD